MCKPFAGQIGVVLQNGRLMPGEILENIVGSGLFTLDDAWEAAKLCGIGGGYSSHAHGNAIRCWVRAPQHYPADNGNSRMIARAIVAKPLLDSL